MKKNRLLIPLQRIACEVQKYKLLSESVQVVNSLASYIVG